MLKDKIQEDLRTALKEKKEAQSSTLRLLLAAILNKEKEKRYKIVCEHTILKAARAPYSKPSKGKPELSEKELEEKSQLTEEEIFEVISSEIKKRKEAILLFDKGGRKDLSQKEEGEIKILQGYLPEQLSEEELKKLIREAIEKAEAKEAKDTRTSPKAKTLNASRILGKVMADLMPKVKGKVDGSTVSRLVKELLS